MSDTDQKASKGMIRYVLTIFVIAIILALVYFTFFTPGKVETTPDMPGVSEGAQ